MSAICKESISELRDGMAATLDELNRSLDDLRRGADLSAMTHRVASSLRSISPIFDELWEALDLPPRASRVRVRRVRRVLLVDDSNGHRALCARVLAAAGYEVHAADDGSHAWALLHDLAFDVLVSDRQMPAMGGLELLGRVRTDGLLERLPVILLTGMDDPNDRETGLAAGASDYISKHQAGALRRLLESVDRLTQAERA
jgi:CheY-like chemotaxis protein